MKINKIALVFSSVLILFFSCQKDSLEESVIIEEQGILINQIELTDKDKLLKETSILIGKLFVDENVREEVLLKISEADQYNELVTLSYLLDIGKTVSKSEDKIIRTGKSTFKKGDNLFKIALAKEIMNNYNNYDYLPNLLGKRGVDPKNSKSMDDLPQILADLLASEEMEIYYPYEDKIISSKEGWNDYYVSYRPIEYVEKNEAFKFSKKNSKSNTDFVSIGIVDNNFVENNKVFIIGAMDDCDKKYMKCDFNEISPIGVVDGLKRKTSGPKLLNYNVNHNSIEEKDIISTRFSGFRINGNDWLGFGATHQKFKVFRGSPDGKIKIDGGNITAESKSYDVGYFKIRAKGARKGWWYDVNEEFDDDWNMSENEQAITVFTLHHLKGSASVKLKTKAGLKLVGTQVKPVAEATVTSEVSISVGSAKQRTKAQLSRRQVLSTIVGKGVTGATRDGTNWNAKKSNIFHYYFKHYYTNL